jgi:DNA modification methylase
MNGGTVIPGDVFEILPLLDDESVQMCMTSPPYWGLRDYGAVDQIGLENTPNEYVDKMVMVFREVRRMLKKDGTLWLNLGDTYAAGGNGGGGSFAKDGIRCAEPGTDKNERPFWKKGPRALAAGLKPKDLVGIPWMIAFALRADGWYLRQDIIWAKSNPMPESVKDRCTKSHEYLFMLSKSANYYCDMDAIKEPCVCTEPFRFVDGGKDKQRGHTRRHAGFNGRYAEKIAREGAPELRNKRDVWQISTKPYKGAHFATFPPDLCEPCILAGSRPGDIVLDPFGGSGTVAQVAKQYGREYLLIELNEDYCELAQRRIDGQAAAPIWTTPIIKLIEAEP